MSRRARLRQFIFEFVDGIKVAWSLAVVHDCEHNNGHSWGEPSLDETLPSLGWTKICTNCGACQTVPVPADLIYVADVKFATPVVSATSSTYTIYYESPS